MFRRTVLLAMLSVTALAQQSRFFPERIGNIGVSRVPAAWSPPENIVRGLRSDDEAARAQAERMLGATQGSFKEGADEIGLQYFSRGVAASPVVIVTAETNAFQYGSVAVLAAGAWKRIAAFECWCKYDNEPGFMSIRYAPLSPEIKLGSEPVVVTVHAVGGGTGEYEQTEAWFALRNDELENAISFASRKTSCQLESSCYDLRRWFDGKQMIEGRNGDLRNTQRVLNKDLEVRSFKSFVCTPYKWDDASFRYAPSGPVKPCAPKTP